ncbi:isocitrate lyase/phosphoenolpyruvate mutase family protein [Dehalococcoides mccartyi]|nr:isocitrate lyase/phosphoenolpyruvate mutase family protein [Dehalococcoides mccartyi]
MTSKNDFVELVEKTELLRKLHGNPEMLVLANVWDAGSAGVVASAGFPAIATTSAGVAWSLGYEDHQKTPVDEMLAAAARITRVVDVPVTVDFEGGYGLDPSEIATRLIDAGACGLNFEDTDHDSGGLVEATEQAERIAQIKRAGQAAGVDLVLNARVDVFIQGNGTFQEQVAEGLRRARMYRDAGADCLYPILLSDKSVISEFVHAVEVININLRPGGDLSLQDVAGLGVRRVSYAVSLFREVAGTVEERAGVIFGEAQELTYS